MLDQTIVIYCICDELIRSIPLKDDLQCKMSSAEVMTFAIMSATLYGCDYRKARLVSQGYRLFPEILSHSQLVRRIHQIPEYVWYLVFFALQVFLKKADEQLFIVDSFPVKAYENHKSFRAKIFSGNKFHGYTASKNMYFFGIKVHMIINSDGIPIEFSFTPGSEHDVKSLKDFSLENLPRGSLLFGDRAYTSYDFEDSLSEIEGIQLVPKRKINLKRQHTQENEKLLRKHRNYIESVFSSIVSRMPRYIRARTEKGFCLKVFFFILA